MDLRRLRAFVVAAEEGHLGRAAARLHITQPTLSRQLAALERELGVSLFSRDRRSLALTATGGIVLDRAQGVLAQADALVTDAARAQQGTLGTVRVGFVQSATFEALPAILGPFRATHPDVVLDARAMTTLDQLPALRSGRLDVGLLRPPRADAGIATRVISRDPLMVALPARDPLARADAVSLAQLADRDFVFYQRPPPATPDPVIYDRIIGHCRTAGFSPRVIQEARDVQTIAALVAASLGVSLLIAPTPPDHGGAVVYRPVADNVPPWELCVAWLPERLSPAAAAFLDVAEQERPSR
jgi:DNA-binding transcriptional LysR family regulator